MAAAVAPAAAAPEGPLYTNQPVRTASRFVFDGNLNVEIDGSPAQLIDLSTSGAQLLSPSALKPNRSVKVLLTEGLLCKGKVVWARLEPAGKGRPLAYRAGVAFINPDEAAIGAFLANTR